VKQASVLVKTSPTRIGIFALSGLSRAGRWQHAPWLGTRSQGFRTAVLVTRVSKPDTSPTVPLTWISFALSLESMRVGRLILAVFVATALVAYVFDCSGTTTPAEAMKCCKSMPCSSSRHSQECCETMPQMHAPFVPSPSAHRVSLTTDLIAVLSLLPEALRSGSAVSRLAVNCHAPPRAGPPTSTPMRI
jgi:hypothetical protein